MPLEGTFSIHAHPSAAATVAEMEGVWGWEIVLDLVSRETTLLSGGTGRTVDGCDGSHFAGRNLERKEVMEMRSKKKEKPRMRKISIVLSHVNPTRVPLGLGHQTPLALWAAKGIKCQC